MALSIEWHDSTNSTDSVKIMPYLDIINACAYNVYQALSSALGGGVWGRGYAECVLDSLSRSGGLLEAKFCY